MACERVTAAGYQLRAWTLIFWGGREAAYLTQVVDEISPMQFALVVGEQERSLRDPRLLT